MVGEHHAAKGAGANADKFDDADARKRSGHVASPKLKPSARHCERSEAIQGGYRRPLDCRVTSLLAMTIVVLDALDDDRRRHRARGAHGDAAIANAETFEFIGGGSDQTRPAGADRWRTDERT